MTKYITNRYKIGGKNGSLEYMLKMFGGLKRRGSIKIIYDKNGEPEYIARRTDRGPGTTHWNSLTES